MHTTIRYILITALRDRIFIGLFTGMFIATGICLLLGSTAFLEPQHMAMALASGAARMILMVGLMVFTCFHIRQGFDSKEIEVMLSHPMSRAQLLLSYWLGFSLVGVLLALPVLMMIALIGPHDLAGYMGWAASLLLEAMLVVAMAIFSSFTLRSAVMSVMSCMGFYILSRLMAFFVMTSQSGLAAAGSSFTPFKKILELLYILVPRLDMFTKSQWLVYGADTMAGWIYVPMQAAIFVPLLLLAAMADFRRQEF